MSRRAPLTEETSCNLCGSRDYEVVSERDRDGAALRTTICRRCGLVWTNPRPTDQALETYYAREYRTDYKNMRRPSRRKLVRGFLGAAERRQRLLPVLHPGMRILDIGCGAGELPYVLRAAGYDARALEPDQAFSAFARDVLQIPIETTSIGDAEFPAAAFDLVTMFHVLEHVADPLATLRRVTAWLNRPATVVIEVPNVEATVQAPRHRFHFAHLFSFSPGTLQALATAAGMAPVSVDLTEDGGNIIGIFRARDGDAPVQAPVGANQYHRTLAVLRRHTTLRHYLSPIPYVRVARRLARRRREDRLLRHLKTENAVLAWARDGGREAEW